MKKFLWRCFSFAAISTFCFVSSARIASATVIGSLNLTSGANTVTVTINSITWNGSFTVANGSTGEFTPLIGTDGTLVNLGTPPIADFMSFAGNPSLFLNLIVIGPGSSSTACAGLTIGQSCSVIAGSPFILTQGANGTIATLGVSGTATDGTLPNSNWFGDFSATITTFPTVAPGDVVTPAAIQAFFLTFPGANFTTPYSGTFTATLVSVPEPSATALALSGLGLIAIAMIRRRKQIR